MGDKKKKAKKNTHTAVPLFQARYCFHEYYTGNQITGSGFVND